MICVHSTPILLHCQMNDEELMILCGQFYLFTGRCMNLIRFMGALPFKMEFIVIEPILMETLMNVLLIRPLVELLSVSHAYQAYCLMASEMS